MFFWITKEFQIGFDVVCVIANDPKSPRYFKMKQSGSYRSGFVVNTLDITAGTYDIVPSTFFPGQEAAFLMTVRCTIPIKISRLQWLSTTKYLGCCVGDVEKNKTGIEMYIHSVMMVFYCDTKNQNDSFTKEIKKYIYLFYFI